MEISTLVLIKHDTMNNRTTKFSIVYLYRKLYQNLKRLKSPDSSLFGSKGVLFRPSGINRSRRLTWGNRGG